MRVQHIDVGVSMNSIAAIVAAPVSTMLSSTTKLTTTNNTTATVGGKTRKGEKKDKGYEVSRRLEGGIVVSRVNGRKVEVE